MFRGGVYLALGDSISVYAPQTLTYTNLIAKQITKDYNQIKYINKAVPGSVSSDVIQYLEWATTLIPDIVTIMLGTNDCTGNKSDVTPLQANLRLIISRLRKKNPQINIILLTPPTCDPTNNNRTNIQSFRDAVASIANEQNTLLVHTETAWGTSQVSTYTSDGLHPNDAGHQLLYNLIYPTVTSCSFIQSISSS